MSEKVTVVTVTFNCANILEQTINSVLTQTYPYIEYIIIDGASKDGTLDVIKSYENQIDFVVSKPDKGIYDAMNKAITFATGNWIIYMNAGDVFYEKDTVAKCFRTKLDGYAAVYGSWYSHKSEGLIFKPCDTPFWKSKQKYKSMGFSHQSVFVRRDWAEKFRFDLSYKCCADYNMIYSIYKNGGRFFCADVPICIFDARDGFSTNNRRIQIKEHARILGIEKTLYFKFFYLKEISKLFIKKILNKD